MLVKFAGSQHQAMTCHHFKFQSVCPNNFDKYEELFDEVLQLTCMLPWFSISCCLVSEKLKESLDKGCYLPGSHCGVVSYLLRHSLSLILWPRSLSSRRIWSSSGTKYVIIFSFLTFEVFSCYVVQCHNLLQIEWWSRDLKFRIESISVFQFMAILSPLLRYSHDGLSLF